MPDVYRFAGLDGYELCRDFHDPGDCGACCVSRGDVDVVPYGSGAGDSGIDRNIIAFRLTGLDQPVNCVLGAAYPDVSYEEDGPPRTESGQLINGVVQASGDKDGTPWIGFSEPVNSVVGALALDGPGAPVIDTARPGLNPKTRSTVLFVHPGRMAREDPAMRTARLGPGSICHFTVLFV